MHKLSSIVLFSLVILYNRIKIYMYKEGSVPMKTKLTYFGHACFMLTRGDVSMIFDPFLTGYRKKRRYQMPIYLCQPWSR